MNTDIEYDRYTYNKPDYPPVNIVYRPDLNLIVNLDTGLYRRITGPYAGKWQRGTQANHEGHLIVRVNGGRVYVHRLIYELAHGPIPDGYVIDHQNNEPQDNRQWNLRIVPRGFNRKNRSVRPVGEIGVYFNPKSGKWMVYGRRAGRIHYYGSFFNKITAQTRFDRVSVED